MRLANFDFCAIGKTAYSSEHNAVNAIFQLIPHNRRCQKQHTWYVGNCSRSDGDDHTLVVSAYSYSVWRLRDATLWSCLRMVLNLPAKRLLTIAFCISTLHPLPTSLPLTYTQHFLTPLSAVCLTCNLSASEEIPSAVSSDKMVIGIMSSRCRNMSGADQVRLGLGGQTQINHLHYIVGISWMMTSEDWNRRQ